MSRQGLIYIVSAPSGAGKTSLCKELLATFPELRMSISYTTRPIRSGEEDGVDYHFVSTEIFKQMIEGKAFAEWAEVHGNYYGTSLAVLEQAQQAGHDVLLDIDCQGAAQLKKNLDNGVFVFVLPPNLEELEKRLVGRETDTADVVRKRIENARKEIPEARWYDYIVVNDNFDFALLQLKAILMAETCRTRVALSPVQGVFEF